MKSIYVALLCLVSLFRLQAQETNPIAPGLPAIDLAKIPCTPKADKLLEFTNQVAYRSGNKWGLFGKTEQAILVPATFDFIYLFDNEPYFYGIVDQKVGLYILENSAALLKPTYYRLGTTSYIYPNIIKNDSLVQIDSGIMENRDQLSRRCETKYIPLSYQDEESVWVTAGKLIINKRFKDAEAFTLYTIDADGNQLDSLDEMGNPVMEYRETIAASGVLDMATGEWDLKPEFFGIKPFKGNYLTTKLTPVFAEEVLTVAPRGVHIRNLGLRKNLGSKDVKALLPYEYKEVSEPVLLSSDSLNYAYYGFYFHTKYGIYDLNTLETVYPPENDFVYVSDISGMACKINNKKLACTYSISGVSMHDEQLDSIGIYRNTDPETENYYVRKNNNWFRMGGERLEPLKKEQVPTLTYATSFSVSGNQLIVNDHAALGPKPPYPIQIYDMYGESRDSCSGYDANGSCISAYEPRDPEINKSGVYDLVLHKWIVPQAFSSIVITSTGYAGMINNELLDSALCTAFDKSGNRIFSDKPLKELAVSPAALKSYTGLSQAVFELVYPLDFAGTVFYLQVPLKTTLNGKTGILELKSLTWIIQPEWDELTQLYEGSYIGLKAGKLGLLSDAGKLIIPAEHTSLEAALQPGNVIADNKWVYNSLETVHFPSRKVDIHDLNVTKYGNTDFSNQVSLAEYTESETHFYQAFLKDNRLIINEYTDNKTTFQYEFFDEYGNYLDSTDIDGNPVMGISGEISSDSRYLDLAKHQWTRMDSVIRAIPVNNEFILQKMNGSFVYTAADFKPLATFFAEDSWNYNPEMNVLTVFDRDTEMNGEVRHVMATKRHSLCDYSQERLYFFRDGKQIVFPADYQPLALLKNGTAIVRQMEAGDGEICNESVAIAQLSPFKLISTPIKKGNTTTHAARIGNHLLIETVNNAASDSNTVWYIKDNGIALDTIWNRENDAFRFHSSEEYDTESTLNQAYFTYSDQTVLFQKDGSVLMANYGDRSPEQLAYDRYLVRTEEKQLLMDSKGQVFVEGDSINWIPVNLDGRDMVPYQMLLTGKNGEYEVYSTDGKLFAELDHLPEQLFTPTGTSGDHYLFCNGKTYQVAHCDGKEMVPEGKVYDTVEIVAPEPFSIYLGTTGEISELFNQSGELVLSLSKGEKISRSFYDDGVYVTEKNGSTKLYEISKRRFLPVVFPSLPGLDENEYLSAWNHEETGTIDYPFMVRNKTVYDAWIASVKDNDITLRQVKIPAYTSAKLLKENKVLAENQAGWYLLDAGDTFKAMNHQPMTRIFCEATNLVTGSSGDTTYCYRSYDPQLVRLPVGALDSARQYLDPDTKSELILLYKNGNQGLFSFPDLFIRPEFKTVKRLSTYTDRFWLCDNRLYDAKAQKMLTDGQITNGELLNSLHIVYTAAGKKYLLNTETSQVIPVPFDRLYGIRYNYEAVVLNGKAGIISLDEPGKWIVEPEYDTVYSLSDYSEDIFPLIGRKNGKSYYIPEAGKILFEGNFENVSFLDRMRETDYFSVTHAGKTGVFDENGKMIIAPAYDNIYILPDFFLVSNEPDGQYAEYKYGLVDTTGKVVLPAEYASIELSDSSEYPLVITKADGTRYKLTGNKKKKLVKLETQSQE